MFPIIVKLEAREFVTAAADEIFSFVKSIMLCVV